MPVRPPAHRKPAHWRASLPFGPRSPRGFVLLLGLACASCSRSDAPAGLERGPLRLPVTVVDPPTRDSSVALVLKLPEDVSEWDIEGMGEARIGQRRADGATSGARVLRLRGDSSASDTRISIRGTFDPKTFNRIAVRATSGRDVYLGAVFYRDGKIQAACDARLRIPGRLHSDEGQAGEPDLVVLRVPDTRLHDEPFSRVLFIFEGSTPAIDVHSIDLIQEPLISWLPDAAREPRLVPVGEDQRRAVGLSSRSTMEFDFRAPKDAVLSVACGMPPEMRFRGEPPIFELLLQGANGHEERREVALETLRNETLKWHDLVVPLAAFGGKSVRATARLAERAAPDGGATDAGTPERVCAVTEPTLLAPRPGAPTVLLVTSDTHRADHVSASNLGVEIRTPVLDELASRGIYFERCFATTNVTNPSHIAMLTAVTPRDTGVVDNMSTLGDAAPTLAEAFRAAGWMSFAAVSVRAMGTVERNIGQGFDRFGAPAEPVRSAAATISQLHDWLPSAGGQPLFIWLHMYDAHAPYEPPAEFQELYYPSGRDPYDPALPEPAIPRGILQPWAEGLRDLEFPNAQYRAEISYLDRELGKLLAEPRFGDAIIAVTADHGESLGDTNIFWDHAELFPANLHVPLILTWPDGPRAQRVHKTVINHNLGRTLLDLAGLEDVEFGGETLLASLDAGFPEDQPRFVLSANATSAALTRGDWHLILHLRKHWRDIMHALEPAPKHLAELYNLADDPGCRTDLAEREPERAQEMRQLLIAWLLDARDTGWSTGTSQDADLLREIAQLGYATSVEGSGQALWDPDCDCRYCRSSDD